MNRHNGFSTSITHRGTVTVLHLSGELDVGTICTLRPLLSEFAGEGVTALVIDAQDLSFMDSCGLRSLIEFASVEDRLTAVVASRPVQLVIKMTGVERLLPLCDTVDDATFAVVHPASRRRDATA